MTDGIIQQWFNHVEDGNGYIPEWLKQELIEKIKQEFTQFNSWDRDLIHRILTGDNNE